MTKSELVNLLAMKQPQLAQRDVDLAVDSILEQLTGTIIKGERIEIRGFGGFSTVKRKPRIGRNPRTGEAVRIPNRTSLHFKPGLDLRNRVKASKNVQ